MKKLLTIISVLALLVVPFANVFAESDDVNIGDAVSFKINKSISDSSKDGREIQTWISMEDSNLNQANVRVWSGPVFPLLSSMSYYTSAGQPIDANINVAFNGLVSAINQLNAEYLVSTAADAFSIPTFDELKSMFITNEANGEFVVDIAQSRNVMSWMSIAVQENAEQGKKLNGYYTSTIDPTDNKLWVLHFDLNADNTIAAAKFTKVSPDTTGYALSVITLADKSFRCGQSACYLCDGKYVYGKSSSVDSTCTLVDDKDVNTCVVNTQTGVQEHVLEGLAIAGICIIVLAVIKRKDAFRNI